MYLDIHCPKCGEFRDKKNAKKGCPRCGNKQAISLWHRDDIDTRFKAEKNSEVEEYVDAFQERFLGPHKPAGRLKRYSQMFKSSK